MMKKFVSMFLALVMCLSLAATAFAAEEEAEITTEPAVQTEVETPTEGEAAVQSGDCSHQNYTVVRRNEIDPNDYNSSGHAMNDMEYHTCTICNKLIYQQNHSTNYVAHKFYNTGLSGMFDDGNGSYSKPLYGCRKCNYTTFDP